MTAGRGAGTPVSEVGDDDTTDGIGAETEVSSGPATAQWVNAGKRANAADATHPLTRLWTAWQFFEEWRRMPRNDKPFLREQSYNDAHQQVAALVAYTYFHVHCVNTATLPVAWFCAVNNLPCLVRSGDGGAVLARLTGETLAGANVNYMALTVSDDGQRVTPALLDEQGRTFALNALGSVAAHSGGAVSVGAVPVVKTPREPFSWDSDARVVYRCLSSDSVEALFSTVRGFGSVRHTYGSVSGAEIGVRLGNVTQQVLLSGTDTLAFRRGGDVHATEETTDGRRRLSTAPNHTPSKAPGYDRVKRALLMTPDNAGAGIAAPPALPPAPAARALTMPARSPAPAPSAARALSAARTPRAAGGAGAPS